MILNALNLYYDRIRSDPDADMPDFGTSVEGISFALVLGKDGSLVEIEDLRLEDGKRRLPRKMPVPAAVIRTSGVKANYLWDKATYVLGADGQGATDRSLACFEAFKGLFMDVGREIEDEGFHAVHTFLDRWECEKADLIVSRFQPWEDLCNTNLIFRLDGTSGFIHDRPALHNAWVSYGESISNAPLGRCLITGESEVPLARIHTPIKGVRGGQTSGGYIVSYNAPAFISYKQDKASVAETSAFTYTTALNYLLSGKSRQKIMIGDTTYTFWAKRPSPAESFLSAMFDVPDQNNDASEQDDKATAEKVRGLLKTVRDGRKPVDFMPELDEDVSFYILGLAPNAARLSIRFWQETRLGDLLDKIGTHYRQLRIDRQFESEPEFPALWRLMRQTATLGKSENISPVLAGGMSRAMLTGAAYPQNLLPVVLDRIRAEHKVTYYRASLIKAYLLRNIQKEVPMSFDPDRTDLPYLLGRLFAVFEKAQEEAIPKTNATITDRYLASAAATPAQVFSVLLKNSVNHIAKLRKDPERKGRSRYFQGLIQDIIAGLNDYPRTLNAEAQGLFMIGYYHQRKHFYTKKNQED